MLMPDDGDEIEEKGLKQRDSRNGGINSREINRYIWHTIYIYIAQGRGARLVLTFKHLIKGVQLLFSIAIGV